jgi:hypothetical protein
MTVFGRYAAIMQGAKSSEPLEVETEGCMREQEWICICRMVTVISRDWARGVCIRGRNGLAMHAGCVLLEGLGRGVRGSRNGLAMQGVYC